jgi:hypothetical protein
MHRHPIRAGIGDHHHDVVRIAALRRHDPSAAAGLPVRRTPTQHALAPVEILFPVRGPEDVLDTNAAERVGALLPMERSTSCDPSALMSSAAVGLRSATSRQKLTDRSRSGTTMTTVPSRAPCAICYPVSAVSWYSGPRTSAPPGDGTMSLLSWFPISALIFIRRSVTWSQSSRRASIGSAILSR